MLGRAELLAVPVFVECSGGVSDAGLVDAAGDLPSHAAVELSRYECILNPTPRLADGEDS